MAKEVVEQCVPETIYHICFFVAFFVGSHVVRIGHW